MSKKKQHATSRTLPRRMAVRLADAVELMQRKRWAEAREILQDLARQYPTNPDVLAEWVNVNYELHDLPTYQEAIERLLKLEPHEPDLWLGLAGAYMGNARPALALRTFKQFLDRFPDHPRAAEAHKTVAELEARMPEWLASANTSGETGMHIAALHEQAQSLLEQGKYGQARRVEDQVLQLKPDFVAALNNISQTYFAEGELDRAMEAAQRVLALEPDNFHALANLTRYLLLKGRSEQALAYAERLKAVESDRTDVWSKKAEGLAYLGDDEGVLEAFRGAERAGRLKPPFADPLLFHLAAVAELRLGHEEPARRAWQQALKVQPGFELAQRSLDDLKNPVGERNAPWPFPLSNWINRRSIQDLLALLKPTAHKGERAAIQATHRFLQQHPEFVTLTPVLLDRGDGEAREFALRLIEMAETPELFAAARDFALGQRGPDALRHRAAQLASHGGLIPSGPVRMWLHGEWSDILLLDFELNDEPTVKHGPRVEKLQAEAVAALHENDIVSAEPLLRQALELEPEAPDVLYNLAGLHELQGQRDQADSLLRQIIARHPDETLARTGLARVFLLRGQVEEAEELLKPVLSHKRFNILEFGAFCSAQIELWLAKNKPEGARSWLQMWESIDQDNPQLAQYRARLGGGWGRLWRGRS